MKASDHFLHTTHRTITWFNKAFLSDELDLAPPYQRNAVWTTLQKSYLLDTVLNQLPIPELYMQDVGDADGSERHVVVDGQQRIRAVLDFVQGNYTLQGDDVTRAWRGLKFSDLKEEDRKAVFAYKFVVRILPSDLREDDIRRIFSRLNKNVAVLTDQEIRNATYWGPFIKTIQRIGDEDPFWSDCGVFSANDYRRMIDHEFISELAIAYLHGPQNKKDKLNTYYQLYEEQFEAGPDLEVAFRKVTSEITRFFPLLVGSRWKKKSDFYTMFLEFARINDRLPLDERELDEAAERVLELGRRVDSLLRLDEGEWEKQDENVVRYARNVARAASDRGSRTARAAAFRSFVLHEPDGVQAEEAVYSMIVEVPVSDQESAGWGAAAAE